LVASPSETGRQRWRGGFGELWESLEQLVFRIVKVA
jgi:hypothetical protein